MVIVSSFLKMKMNNYQRELQRNRTFRRFAYKIGNVLCITPWYDFEKEDLKKPILNKLCAIVYCLVLGIFVLATKFLEDNKLEENIFERILCILSAIISILLIEFLIFGSTFIQGHIWKSFLKKLSFSKSMENCCDYKTIAMFYFQLFLGHLFFISCMLYQGYTWHSYIGSRFVLPFLSVIIREYYSLIYALVASNIALILKCLYQELNRLLEEYVEQYFVTIQVGKSEEKVVKYILEVGKQYRYITELVHYYNRIFGWMTLLIFWNSIVQLLRCANLILQVMDDDRFSWVLFLSLLGPSMISMAESASIVLCCEMAASAGEMFKRTSYKLQENFDVDSVSRKELFNLAEIVGSHEPKFTAANFFIITKGTVLSIISITTTYLIVIIQFNVRIHERYMKNCT